MTSVYRPRAVTNPKKLLKSKWTAVTPLNKEKHFIVTQLVFETQDHATPQVEIIHSVVIEAVYSKNAQTITWKTLNDPTIWQQGWV